MKNNITVIILNYKKYKDLRRAILSVEAQINLESFVLDILIIDNNSEDNSTKKTQAEFPKYRYIYNQENVGFAKGVNQGIKTNLEHSDYFLLLNDDAEIAPDCLSKLIRASSGQNIAGPAIFYKSHPEIVWQGGGFYKKIKMGIVVPDKNKPAKSIETKEVRFLSGCVLLIPKSVFEKIGMFDEHFFFYGEDIDLSIRATNKGVRLLYVQSAKAWHNIDKIAKSRTSPFVLKNLAIAYFLIIRKHFYKYRFYGLLLFIVLYTPFRMLQIMLGGNNYKNISGWLSGGKIGWKTKI